MTIRKNKASTISILAGVLFLASAALWAAAAQKDSFPRAQNKLALAEDQVKQLLPLIECDSHGRVSKRQFMQFMEAEFERLDKSGRGQLDVKALLQQPAISATHFVGK